MNNSTPSETCKSSEPTQPVERNEKLELSTIPDDLPIADPPSPPPLKPVGHFIKLHGIGGHKFGIAGMGKPPRRRSVILVQTKAGELIKVKVGRILWAGEGSTGVDGLWHESIDNWEATFIWKNDE